MKALTIVFSCVLMAFSSCKRTEKTTEFIDSKYTFNFVKSDKLSDVIDLARSQDKLVFLDVYTDWCMPCKMMDEDVFTDKRLGAFFNENFISYKVDAEKDSGPLLAELYEVLGYPTLLFLDQAGKVLVSKAGVAYQREMYNLAEEAIALKAHI